MARVKDRQLYIYQGHQYTADRLPAGVRVSDATPAEDWFKQNRSSTYVPTRQEDTQMAFLGSPLTEEAPGATSTAPVAPDSRESHGEVPLVNLDYPGLKDRARDAGIEFSGNISKADLIDLIEKAEGA